MDDTTIPAASLEQRLAERRRSLYLTRACRSLVLRGKSLEAGEGTARQTLPLSDLAGVVVLGPPRFDAALLYALLRKGVPVFFLDSFGRPLGQALPETEEVFLYWREQAALQDNREAGFAPARRIVAAKIHNAAALLHTFGIAAPALRQSAAVIIPDGEWDRLRGHEGAAARYYFGQLARLTGPFAFPGRQARPAPDPVNSMLSLGYSLLRARLAFALRREGLHPGLGFYHRGRGRHAALASDLMEDLRCVVDGLVLRLVRKNAFTEQDFILRGRQCVFRTGKAFSVFVEAFERMMVKLFAAPVDRPGCPAGSRTSMNQWLDATAAAYAAFVHRGKPFDPFRLRLRAAAGPNRAAGPPDALEHSGTTSPAEETSHTPEKDNDLGVRGEKSDDSRHPGK